MWLWRRRRTRGCLSTVTVKCLAGETGYFRLLFWKCMFPVAWGRWEFEASSPNVHFFIWQTPCKNRWSWVSFGFYGVFVLCSHWECIDSSPAHNSNLIGHCCDDVTAAATGDWPFMLLAFCFSFVAVHATVKQTSCRNRLNRRIKPNCCSYLFCLAPVEKTFFMHRSCEGPAVDRCVSNGV